MLVHTLLSGVRVGGRTTVERVRGLWSQVREMCVLRFRRGMFSYELRVSSSSSSYELRVTQSNPQKKTSGLRRFHEMKFHKFPKKSTFDFEQRAL